MRIPGRSQAFVALRAVLASEVGCTGRTINQTRLDPDSLIFLVPTTLAVFFSSAMLFLSRCHGPLYTNKEWYVLLFLCVVTTPHHCCLASRAWRLDHLVSADRLLTISGDRGANCTNVHHACLIAGVVKSQSSMFTTYLSSAEVPTFRVTKCLQPTDNCCGTVKRISRIRSVARTVSSRRRIGWRAMELVNRHESFLALSNRGALSVLDTSFKFARASYLVLGNHGQHCAWN